MKTYFCSTHSWPEDSQLMAQLPLQKCCQISKVKNYGRTPGGQKKMCNVYVNFLTTLIANACTHHVVFFWDTVLQT